MADRLLDMFLFVTDRLRVVFLTLLAAAVAQGFASPTPAAPAKPPSIVLKLSAS